MFWLLGYHSLFILCKFIGNYIYSSPIKHLMLARKLGKFRIIFERDDYNYISDKRKIDEISNIIIYRISNPDGQEQFHKETIKAFLVNLKGFYEWLNAENITDLKQGYLKASAILSIISNLLSKPIYERTNTSGKYLKKFNKVFLYSLLRLYQGIKLVFDPDILSKTNIQNTQLARYFLDRQEGLSRAYAFNIKGNYSARRLNKLSKNDLVDVLDLLTRNRDVRLQKGWLDYGSGKNHPRVLAKKSLFGRVKVYYIFTAHEHRDYERVLDKTSYELDFAEVA